MTSLFKEKTLEMVNNNVRKIINEFAIKGKYRLIGSNSLRAIHYASDYDVETQLRNMSPKMVAKRFQQQFYDAKKSENIWITDFKCGWDKRLVYRGDYSDASVKNYLKNSLIPKSYREKVLKSIGEERIDLIRDLYILRWKYDDIMRGEIKLIDGKYKKLVECILDKTPLKIDLIGKVGDMFVEMSENYYVKIGNEKNYTHKPTRAELEGEFEDEIHYYASRDKFKALKRLFSLLQIEGEKGVRLENLVTFFNGEVGYLNKIKNELKILEALLVQDFRPVPFKDIYNNLQVIKEQIANVYQIKLDDKLFKMIDELTAKSALDGIKCLIDYFQKKINLNSKDFLKMYI
jgi:hypothetical protein